MRPARRFLTSAALLALFFASLTTASAIPFITGTQTWTPGGAGDGNGTWDTVTANWSGPGGVPTSGEDWTNSDSALFTGTGGNVSVTSVTATAITFDATGLYALTSGTLTMSGSSIAVDSVASIGSDITATAAGLFITGNNTLTLTGTDSLGSQSLTLDSGAVTISGGGSVSGAYGYIGKDPGSTGSVTVSGSGSIWANSASLYVGRSGSGTLLITNGGTVSSTGGGIIGFLPGSIGSATVSGSGSTWTSVGGLLVGTSGTGSLLITGGGAVSSAGGGLIGYLAGSIGAATVTGSGSTWSSGIGLVVGGSGAGTLAISSGGSVTSGTGTYIGDGVGSTGAATVDGIGSIWTNTGNIYVGESGSGSLFITDGGAVSTASNGIISDQTGSTGVASVSGTGSTWTLSGDLYVGNSGTGTLAISAGGAVSDINGWVGYAPGSSGSVTVDGSGSAWDSNDGLYVGESGSGSLSITNGASVASADGYDTVLGDQAGSFGSVSVSGTGSTFSQNMGIGIFFPFGIVTIPADLIVGGSGTGTLLVSNGGSVFTSGDGFIGYQAGSSGSVTVSGSGSTWTVSNSDDVEYAFLKTAGILSVGESGSGTLLITNGGAVSSFTGYIGDQAGSSGSVTVTGTGSMWTDSGNLIVSNAGSGALAISAGGAVSDTNGWIGYGASTSGLVTVDGSGSTWTNSANLYVGESGSGTLSITNGASVTTGSGGIIGDQAGSVGLATVSGSGGASTWTDSGDLVVGGSGTGTLKVSLSGAVSDVNGWLGYGIGSNGLVGVSGTGSTWTNSGGLYVGESGTGRLNVLTGATVSSGTGGVIGDQAGSTGVVTVTGTGSTWTEYGDLYVGNSGTGTLLITNAGAVSNGQGDSIGGASIGQVAGSSGSVTVTGSGSTWMDEGNLNVGYSGSGTLTISNGASVSNGNDGIGAIIAYDPGSTGAAIVTGSGSRWTSNGNLYVADSGTGSLLISNGGLVRVNYDSTYLGYSAGSSGSVTVTGTGSTWTNQYDLIVGYGGRGSLTISNGATVSNGQEESGAVIADYSSSSASAAVTGSGSLWTDTGSMYVGDSGTGTLLISSGARVTVGESAYVGYVGGSLGSVTVTGSGSSWTAPSGDLYVGYSGAGTLLISNGASVTNGNEESGAVIGYYNDSSGSATVTGTGSTWTSSGNMYVGSSGTGTLLISAGAVVSDSNSAYIAGNTGGNGSVTVTGSGSALNTPYGDLFVGGYGPGKLLISNGASVTNGDLEDGAILGADYGGSGSVTVTGTGSKWTDNGGMTVAGSGPGTLVISNGGVVSVNDGPTSLAYGYESVANVTVTGIGSAWNNVDDLSVGSSGSASLLVSAGATLSNGYSEEGATIAAQYNSTGSVTVTGSGSKWTVNSPLNVGYSGPGTLTISNGGVVAVTDGPITIAGEYNSSGHVTVTGSGSALTDVDDLTVGSSGSATLLVSAGATLSSGSSNSGATISGEYNSYGAVTVTGSGSKWTVNSPLNIGYDYYGTLAISNGGLVSVTDGPVSIADEYGSVGILTITGSGSALNDLDDFSLANSGSAALVVSAGATLSTGDSSTGATIAGEYGSTGNVTVTGSGSTWTVNSPLSVGYDAHGTLTISNGGAVSVTGSTSLGGEYSSRGSVTVTGSGSSLSGTGLLYVGYSGSGSMLISAGGSVSSGSGGSIGQQIDSIGNVTVTGSGSQLVYGRGLQIGNSGNGTLLISSGGLVSDSNAWIGLALGSTGAVTMTGTGSTWTNSGNLIISDSGSGTLTMTSGAHVSVAGTTLIGSAGSFNFDGASTLSTGSLVINGGTLRTLGNLTFANSATLQAGGMTVGTGGFNSTFSGVFNGAGGIVKTGSGTLALSGSNTYQGGNTLLAGTLQLGNTLALGSAACALAVDGGTLDLHGFSPTVGPLSGDSAGIITSLVSGTSTLVVNGTANSVFAGEFQAGAGQLSLLKTNTGILTLSGSSNLGANLLVASSGGVQIASGGFLSDATGYIGDGGTNTVTVFGAGSEWSNTSGLFVGQSATGTLADLNGGLVTDPNAFVGLNAGAHGAAIISGSGSTWTNTGNLFVGYSGVGTLTITSSGSVSDASGFIGYNTGSSGLVTVSGSGSTWNNTSSLAIGQSGTGTLAIENGGAVSVTGATTIGALGTLEFDGLSTFGTGSLTINGGTLATLGASTFAASATLGSGGVKINCAGSNSTFSGNFSGAGGLAKSGSGTITLTGASTYTGATTVNAGTLALTTGASHTASLGNTAITVSNGATFSPTLAASPYSTTVSAGTAGAGAAGATLTLAPGSAFSMADGAIGTFNLRQETAFSGPAFTIGGASGVAPSLTFDIGNAATGPDSIGVTKTVTVLATGGRITIDALAGDTSLTAGNYDLITSAGGFSGSGGNHLTLTDTTLVVDGATYDFSLANSTADDEVLTVSVAAVVPSLESRSFDSHEELPAAAAPRGSTPLIGTAAVPEPSTVMSLISVFALAAALRFRHRLVAGSVKKSAGSALQ